MKSFSVPYKIWYKWKSRVRVKWRKNKDTALSMCYYFFLSELRFTSVLAQCRTRQVLRRQCGERESNVCMKPPLPNAPLSWVLSHLERHESRRDSAFSRVWNFLLSKNPEDREINVCPYTYFGLIPRWGIHESKGERDFMAFLLSQRIMPLDTSTSH